jgi:chemotaxis protein CheD
MGHANMLNHVAVGLGELRVSRDPQDVLVSYGLGSCVGIGLYDPVLHIAGLLHALLPAHSNDADGCSPKYVDSGVQALLDEMTCAGADRNRLVVRMAGGANMLVAPGFSQTLNIGARNVEAAYAALQGLRLKISGQEVGGNTGRTVRFYVANGRMTIRTIGNQERDV